MPICAPPIALITGITGQDGSYLTELLLAKGYEVHGLAWRPGDPEASPLKELARNPRIHGKRLFFHYGDLADGQTLRRVFHEVTPGEVYHLGGQSHVGKSFQIPESTCEEVGMASLRLLESSRALGDQVKIYLASTAEVFGDAAETPQTEETKFRPTSPYGCAKAFMTQIARVYRESYGIFVCNGILYNHESPRRGQAFVTRKISRTVAAIKLGLENKLILGNTKSRRDWGHARDYVRAMWMMLQHPKADDYVVATGITHSVQDFVEAAFRVVGLPWEKYLVTDPALERVLEPKQLVGNPAKIQRVLGWRSEHTFDDLVREMVEADLASLAAREPAIAL
ncbi:MAG: GDP-mannose 4,6-dehydratase [Chthoniobacteraceae bacterium]|nr:GDP-mannose 4,6-dehydratase [Chthoniobacteraceae bacterium]